MVAGVAAGLPSRSACGKHRHHEFVDPIDLEQHYFTRKPGRPPMSILKIARLGHPVLRRVADPVDPADIPSAAIQRLIQDLLDTVDEADGAGLAAPQVHASVRIVVLQLDAEVGMEVWINPELTPTSEDELLTFEGCLSVPGLRGLVARPAEVTVRGLDENGVAFERHLEGFPAVVAQHECDHLDGVIYVDKVQPQTLTFLDEYRRYGRMLWGPEPEGDGADSDELDQDDDITDAGEGCVAPSAEA